MASFAPEPPSPLRVTVRFTTSIPDLLLDIPDPNETTAIALKHLVRSKLDAPTNKHRYRLIHSGKLLKDDDLLSTALKIPPPPLELPIQKEKSTAPAPRGFDRLLSGGFTPAEVNQLRLQFLSIQSNIHTPDTMPSPEVLRRMEDAWIDDNAGNTGAGAGEGGFDFGDDGLGGGALDDLLWGISWASCGR
ncbi:hypothetical protein D0Z07_0191 [Hyphodiscus hymeniophilus]|uniref:Ubiquitin-like domain-containing protein n=1 Tax=Hyphodiscus hymeniophilus TaxID=353542 RepID=A0A9P6VRG6_9HELO|nr:hypothetical protein D0Z07_0191 [Hyphodiscus hymeniophilus]